jgi:hypothetical protein
VLALLLALLACSPPAATETPADLNPASPATKTATPTPTPAAAGAPEQTEPPETDLCPTDTTTFELAASHVFWTETGMGKWNWEAFGSIPVIVTASGAVGEGSQGIAMGQQFGTFSSGRNTCTFTAPAEVQISASGVCQDSVLTLEITENWQMGTYDWTCDDDIFQAQVPPMGAAVHPGVTFSLQDVGSYTFEIPWGGGGGTKTYTLYPNIEPVPLVTP